VALQWYTNKGNKDKVSNLKQEMSKMNISLRPIKFGEDNRNFSIDRENNIINKTMSSVKNMQAIVPEVMYELGLTQPKSFMNVLGLLKDTKVNKKSLDILIHLDYFSQFGHIHQLLSQVKIYADLLVIYDRLKTCKQLYLSELPTFGFTREEVEECSNSITPKTFKELDNQALLKLFRKHYKELLAQVSAKYPYAQTTIMDKLKYEVELLGYTDLVDENVNADYYIVLGIDTNNYGTPFANLYHISTGFQKTIKVDKKWYGQYKLEVGNVIDGAFDWKYKGHYEEVDGKKKWIQDKTEMYEILLCWKFV
jgi:DNA polymerase III alpha subunit